MCVLRNLSYQLEGEVDLQDGAEDVLDRDWEAEQRRELEELSTRYRTVSCTLPLPLSPPHSLPLPLPPSLSLPLTLSPPPTLPPLTLSPSLSLTLPLSPPHSLCTQPRPKKGSTPGCLSMCTRPRTSDSPRLSPPAPSSSSSPSGDFRRPYLSRQSVVVDFANPGVCGWVGVCVCVLLQM